MPIVNFVTDFGAPTDGVTNASPAVDLWLAYAAANDGSTLIIPAHPYHLAGTNGLSLGVRNCTIQAEAGASVDALFIGHSGLIVQDFSHSARIQTVQAGATSVSLVTGSQISRFSLNQWIMVAGLGIQAGAGYPPNFQYNEFRQITAINGSTISFSGGLTFAYLSTWPLVDPLVASNYDQGGPATIYALTAEFDSEQTYFGLTSSTPSGGIGVGGGRSLIIDSMVFAGDGPSISVGKSILLKNTNFGDLNEIDKCIEFVEYRDCFSTVGNKQLQIQSACPNILLLTNTVMTTLNGTPQNVIVNGGSITVLIGGALGFGRTNTMLILGGATIGPIDPQSGTRVATHIIPLADVTFSNGQFRVSNSGNLYDFVRLFVPGYQYAIGYSAASSIDIIDATGRVTHFLVSTMTQDALFTYIQTDLTALPTGTFAGHAANSIFAYGCKSVNLATLAAITAWQEPAIPNSTLIGPPSGSPNFNPITTTSLRHRNSPVPSGYPHAKSSLVSPYGHRPNQRLGSTFKSGSPGAHRIGSGTKLPPRRK